MKVQRPLAVAMLLGAAMLTAQGQEQRGKRQGRGPGGFGGAATFLLTQKSVQEDLKMSEEQVKKVTELMEKQRSGFQGLKDLSREERRKKFEEQGKVTQKAVAEILKPEQVKRLKQIGLQQQGVLAIANPEVAGSLGITAEQKEKLKTIMEGNQKAISDLFQGGFNEETRKKMQELRKEAAEKVQGVLTTEQKAKWKELAGEPFKGEIRRPEGRRRPSAPRNKT